MLIRLHKKATTTPAIQDYIRTCGKPLKVLARELNRSVAFDRECAEHGIEHRLIPPGRPQTNGMVERFNGRVADLPRSTRFQNAAEPSTALGHYRDLYNGRIPRRALGHLCPLQALKAWQAKQPALFVHEIHNLAGLDS